MKVGPQSQTLVSLTSLLDASRQKKQVEDQEKTQINNTRENRVADRSSERDQAIQQNRDALRIIQDDIRVKSLAKLKENDELEGDNKSDLNLREKLGGDIAQPKFKKLGQIIDIRI